MSDDGRIPVLQPRLPDADALLPYLRRIDAARVYSNFGPLHEQLRARLTADLRARTGDALHAVLTSSATLALELMLADLDLAPGARIGVPALTFVATATAVLRAGHVPVALDVDPHSWLLLPPEVRPAADAMDAMDAVDPAGAADAADAFHVFDAAAAFRGLDAVVPVCAFGMPQHVDGWHAWQQATGVPVIVDAAGAWGARSARPGIGAVISLHATKSLSTGEGGLIVTADAAQAERLRRLTTFGAGSERPAGTNAKLSEFHAAVGLAHHALWPAQAAQRDALAAGYRDGLARELAHGRLRLQQPAQADIVIRAPTMFPVACESAALRARIEQYCADAGIETRRWYVPATHRMSGVQAGAAAGCPHADRLVETLVCLPLFPDMSAQQQARVIGAVRTACGTTRSTVRPVPVRVVSNRLEEMDR